MIFLSFFCYQIPAFIAKHFWISFDCLLCLHGFIKILIYFFSELKLIWTILDLTTCISKMGILSGKYWYKMIFLSPLIFLRQVFLMCNNLKQFLMTYAHKENVSNRIYQFLFILKYLNYNWNKIRNIFQHFFFREYLEPESGIEKSEHFPTSAQDNFK